MFRHACSALFLVAATAGVSAVASPALAAHKHATQPPKKVLFQAINSMRKKHHLPPFKLSAKLSACARIHSISMANKGADGTLFHDLTDDICTRYSSAGENIGYSSGTPDTAVLVINSRMMAEGPCTSACPAGSVEWELHGHYLNLTSRVFKVVGIGVFSKYYAGLGQRLTWVTEDFVQP